MKLELSWADALKPSIASRGIRLDKSSEKCGQDRKYLLLVIKSMLVFIPQPI